MLAVKHIDESERSQALAGFHIHRVIKVYRMGRWKYLRCAAWKIRPSALVWRQSKPGIVIRLRPKSLRGLNQARWWFCTWRTI